MLGAVSVFDGGAAVAVQLAVPEPLFAAVGECAGRAVLAVKKAVVVPPFPDTVSETVRTDEVLSERLNRLCGNLNFMAGF